MAAANSNVQITDLDFDSIKSNLKTFLRSQDKFKDYDFEGSGLAVLLDLLSYNTHYNAYYLNMVANEMFMDTAALRSSVVSHAKLLNYTPISAQAPTALITLQANEINTASLTLPKFTKFKSEAVDGVNYSFITKDSTTVDVVNGTATFTDLEIIQGEPINVSYTYSSLSNPKQIFVLPDPMVDTSSIVVQVQQSSSNNYTETYTLSEDASNLTSSSLAYFLQEGLSEKYEIYFGDGIVGKQLSDGNIVRISYVVTGGLNSVGANNFVLIDSVGSGNNVIYPVMQSTNGRERETVDSIRFNAPKTYATQGRAVTTEDYITIINNNKLGFSFDAINAWGGADNVPPVYGQVFISLKPTGGYTLTQTQKQKLINNVIKPVSVLTVTPTIVDPDYTYLNLTIDAVYDQKRTSLTAGQLTNAIKTAVQNFADSTLNTFNSTFVLADLITTVQNVDKSIITNNCNVKVEKKLYPLVKQSKNYVLNYGVPLERGQFNQGISSTPTMQYYDVSASNVNLLPAVYIEEVPFVSSGIQEINIINPGFNYTQTPIVSIIGDGTGATAEAEVINNTINRIIVTNSGNNYTQAVVTITPDPLDKSGNSGSAYAVLQGQFGRLRSYYFDTTNFNKKTILNDNVATVDYYNGTITFESFAPYEINNAFGRLSIIANPQSTIISSSQNRIVTLDPYDSLAITVNLTTR